MAHRVSTELTPQKYREIRDAIEDLSSIGVVPLIWGYPGIGKTSMCRAIAKEKGMKFTEVYLTQRTPPDVGGFIMPSKDGTTAFRTQPDFFPKEDEPTLILFDEILAAHDSVRKAAFELLLERRIGGYQLQEHHIMVAATNMGSEDATIINPMDAPTSDRFGHLWLHPDVDDWIRNYATPSGVNAAVVSFLVQNRDHFLPEKLREEGPGGSPTTVLNPRSWVRVAAILDDFDDGRMDWQTARVAIRGIIPRDVEENLHLFSQQAGTRHHIVKLLSCDFGNMQKNMPDTPEALMTLAASLPQHVRLTSREKTKHEAENSRKMELKHAKLFAICALLAGPSSKIGSKRKEIGAWCAGIIMDAIEDYFVKIATKNHDDDDTRTEGQRTAKEYIIDRILLNANGSSTLKRTAAMEQALQDFRDTAQTGFATESQRKGNAEQQNILEQGRKAAAKMSKGKKK